MHQLQQKLLNLASKTAINAKKLRATGRLVDEKNPQNIKHHLAQLEKNGFIKINLSTGEVKVLKPSTTISGGFFSLPILGAANCGDAKEIAEEHIEGYLQVSPSMVTRKTPEGLFVIRAVGDSLNKACKLTGGTIESGDYVVVDGNKRNPNEGEYVLSVIDGVANLKRYHFDKDNNQIALLSESTLDLPPIYIHPDDHPEYMINGAVVRVIKKPKN